jgi:hypothetical protein
MKKILSLILGIMTTFSANAQNQNLKSPVIPSYKKAIDQIMNLKSYDGLKIDSIVNESWNSSDSTFTNSNKDTWQYSNGKGVLAMHYNWDNNAGEWVASFKNEYSYDVNGYQILNISSIWDASASQWNQASKSVMNPDQNGNDTLAFSFNWDKTLGEWAPGSKYVYDYDESGNQIYFLLFQWSAGNTTWDSVYKSDIYRDENGKDTTVLTSFWDAGTSQWNTTNKSKSFYDESGVDTLTCQYNWSAESNDWMITQKNVPEYYMNGEDSVVSVYGWNSVENQWAGSFRFEMLYETDKSFVNQYMWLDGQWQFFSKITTYYSEYLPSGISNPVEETGVYPNPAREFIVIDMPDISNTATIQIFNVQGKKVLDQKIPDGKQISTSGLSKGIYLYRIINNRNSSTGKLVIE